MIGRPPAFDPEWGRVTKPRVGRLFCGLPKDEFRSLLCKHGIEWDERYIWD